MRRVSASASTEAVVALQNPGSDTVESTWPFRVCASATAAEIERLGERDTEAPRLAAPERGA
jgi:hypothetical protein